VETRCGLYAHAGWDEHKVQVTQIRLAIPRLFVLVGESRNDRVVAVSANNYRICFTSLAVPRAVHGVCINCVPAKEKERKTSVSCKQEGAEAIK
jgi:hypothetical protein